MTVEAKRLAALFIIPIRSHMHVLSDALIWISRTYFYTASIGLHDPWKVGQKGKVLYFHALFGYICSIRVAFYVHVPLTEIKLGLHLLHGDKGVPYGETELVSYWLLFTFMKLLAQLLADEHHSADP